MSVIAPKENINTLLCVLGAYVNILGILETLQKVLRAKRRKMELKTP